MLRLKIAATVTALLSAMATLPPAAAAIGAGTGSAWQVTLYVSAGRIVVDHRIVLSGRVGPGGAARGRSVTLQEKFKPGAPWKARDTAKVGRHGTYRFVTRPTTVSTHRYRVVMRAGAHHQTGTSAHVRVAVFHWIDLDSLADVNDVGIGFGTVTMGGTSYEHSMSASPASSQDPTAEGTIEFDLGRRCTSLRATFGISDDSTAGGEAEVSVQADRRTLYSHTFDEGQTDEQQLVMKRKPRMLELEAHSTSTDSDVFGLGAFGSPRVLCTR